MKFNDFHSGMVIEHPPITVTEAEIIEFAQKYDPQWFHTDKARAEQSSWNGLISSGWLTCSLAMRMIFDVALHDSESFGSPGLDAVHWFAPVRPNDSLALRATVNEVRISKSRPNLGILNWTWRLYNQDDVQVLEITATSLFNLDLT